jgi:hypothetical protein
MPKGTKTINTLWNSFRDSTIDTLDTTPGDFQLCVGNVHDPIIIIERSSKNPRSVAIKDDWEFRKIRARQSVSEHYGLAEDRLNLVIAHEGQVFFRMKPQYKTVDLNTKIGLAQYRAEILNMAPAYPGLKDGLTYGRTIGWESFTDGNNFEGMICNRIHRELVAEGKLRRVKIRTNLDSSRHGNWPVYGYGKTNEPNAKEEFLAGGTQKAYKEALGFPN